MYCVKLNFRVLNVLIEQYYFVRYIKYVFRVRLNVCWTFHIKNIAEFITSVRRYAIFLLLVFWKKHFNVIVYPCFSITIINWWPLGQQYKYRRNSTTSSMYWWRRCGQNGFWSVATLIYRQLLDTLDLNNAAFTRLVATKVRLGIHIIYFTCSTNELTWTAKVNHSRCRIFFFF